MLSKKFIAALVLPVATIFSLQVLALAARVYLKRPRLSYVLSASAIFLTLLLGLRPLAETWISTLEDHHAPLSAPPSATCPCDIVVLGSGHSADRRLPALARLDDSGRARLAEAIRLMRAQSTLGRLVVSGGARGDSQATAEVMADAAVSLGVPSARIVAVTTTFSTADEAQQVSALLGKAPFIVVTSAWHMPRAMRLFDRAGSRAIAAPCDFLGERPASSSPARYLPSAGGLWVSERAASEYLALTWDWLSAT